MEDVDMSEKSTMYIGVEVVQSDLGVSRAKAYEIIKDLNRQMHESNPRLLVINGKVNRTWYNEAILKKA